MFDKMNHEEAQKLAQEIDARYELRTTVRDFEDKELPSLNHSYVGVWYEKELLFSLNNRQQWEAIRNFAYKMVQIDADLRQEEIIDSRTHNAAGVPLESLPFEI